MRRIILAMVAMLSVLPMAADEVDATVTINNAVKYQHVSGFGGFSPSPTWSYWLNNSDMDKLFGHGDNQLGLNILRLYMANSKGAWSAGVANARRAKGHGAFVFASPWSPPGSWKTNNSDSNGGSLLESRYPDWANFLNDYYVYMRNQGVEIDAVSIQNEPDWNASYQSCIWTGEQMAKFLREQGSKIGCKIIAPEAIHFTRSMHEPILNDAGACAELDILGGHFYGWDGSSYPLAAQKGKEVWMTEFLINERQQNQGLDINWKDDGFLFARSINDAMLANMSAWVHYSLKRYYGCIGDGTYGTVNDEITKRGYILSHYAKYVSGTTRVRHLLTDPQARLSVSAYETAGADSIVVMVLNPSDNAYNLTLNLPFNTLACSDIVTTEDENMVRASVDYGEETSQPVHGIDPYSVCTLIFAKSSSLSGTGDADIEGTVVFADNFALYGASCVPDGWRTTWEEGVRYAGNYTLGPRVMSFSPEGIMNYAFYFRSSGSNAGDIAFGQDSEMPLHLIPGTYTLNYALTGWKGQPSVTASVKRSGSRNPLVSETVVPTGMMEANGPSERIIAADERSITFDISTEANYILRWDIPKTAGGYAEALVGNITLVRHDEAGVHDVLNDSGSEGTLYDMLGRPVAAPAPGLYIRDGRIVIVK